MSKTAEEKALEAYPKDKLTAVEAVNRAKRFGYIQGYDKAMQDFLEKACEWLIKHNRGQLVEQFKQYIQDESEN